MNQIQLKLFPEKQIIVSLLFTRLAGSFILDVRGPGLAIASSWYLWHDIVAAFPILSKSVLLAIDSEGELETTIELSEETWKVWSNLRNWPDQTRFYWD